MKNDRNITEKNAFFFKLTGKYKLQTTLVFCHVSVILVSSLFFLFLQFFEKNNEKAKKTNEKNNKIKGKHQHALESRQYQRNQ